MNKKHADIDFQALNVRALDHFEALMEKLGLAEVYKVEGNDWKPLNPKRVDHNTGSFAIDMNTGVWADFAVCDVDDKAKGGDLVSLVAYILGLGQGEAARWLEQFLDELDDDPDPSGTKAASPKGLSKSLSKVEAWMPVLPVPEDAPEAPQQHFTLGTPARLHTYTDERGQVLVHICRFEKEDGSKEFRPLTYCRNHLTGKEDWRWSGPENHRPLLHLQEMANAPDAPILLCEGEKAAEAASALFPSWVTTTTMNGAKSAKKSNFSPLAGRDVYIWPDADEPGERYAQDIIAECKKLTPVPRIFKLKPITLSASSTESGEMLFTPGFIAPPGWDAADAVAEGWTAAHIARQMPHLFEEIVLDPSVSTLTPTPSGLPFHTPHSTMTLAPTGTYTESRSEYEVDRFTVNDQGVFYEKKVGRESKTVKISSRIDVMGYVKNVNGQGHGMMLRVWDAYHQYQDYAQLRAQLGERDLGKALRDRGASLNPSETAALIQYLQTATPGRQLISLSQPGWIDDDFQTFFLPGKTRGENVDSYVMEGPATALLKRFEEGGTFQGWQEMVKPCENQSRATLALCAALSGPFLKPLGQENTGLHFVGPSSIGKTTLLRLAGSVWGHPRQQIQTWRATDNALESVASGRNHTLLLLDEMAQVEPKQAGEIVYQLGNGIGKLRANTNALVKEPYRWLLTFISTGEIELDSHMTTAGRRSTAGQEMRLLHVQADVGNELGIFDRLPEGFESSEELAIHLQRGSDVHYGSAGVHLIEIIVAEGVDTVRQVIRQKMNTFKASCAFAGATGQALRALERFALFVAVGEFAVEKAVLPWTPGSVIQAIRDCWQAWLDNHGGGVENLELFRGMERVKNFFQTHGNSRFELWDPPGITEPLDIPRIFNRAGYRRPRVEGDVGYFYVFPATFRDEVCAGLDYKLICRELQRQGLLVHDHNALTKNVRVRGETQTAKMYVIRDTIVPNISDEDPPAPAPVAMTGVETPEASAAYSF